MSTKNQEESLKQSEDKKEKMKKKSEKFLRGIAGIFPLIIIEYNSVIFQKKFLEKN